MAFPVLPPKYYLTHFFEFLDFLEEHYLPVMEASHREFIASFRSLSEDAQCVYVRMVNRKGYVFDKQAFKKYSEISQTEEALQELLDRSFAGRLNVADKQDLLQHLTKPKLLQWLKHSGIEASSSLSKNDLVELAFSSLQRLSLERLEAHEELIARRRVEEMEYLLFLYFGSIHRSLNLYTLRDLGIRQSGTIKKEQFKPRFNNLSEAQAEYFFARALDRFYETDSPEILNQLFTDALSYTNLKSSTQLLKDELLFRLGEYFLETDNQLALTALLESGHAEARIKAARHLYKAEQRDECRKLLEEILENPRDDEELLFAEDFLARKYEKKKQGYLTEVIRSAPQLELSELYLKRPEQGVADHFKALGYKAEFTENYLWVSLFGIFLWAELFENEDAAIHNPFERSPVDLVASDFYNKNSEAIEARLLLLKDPAKAEGHVLKVIAENYGRLNDIFQWHPICAPTLVSFLRHATDKDLAQILRTMAKNFEANHSGFPDLMLEKEGQLKFIEVKAEGDSLRANQLAKMRLLREAGFEVEVLRVNWKPDPNQVYVVVDVETTGGSAGFHRITEIGAVKIQNGKIIDEFQTLINPGRSIPAFITGLTGISNEMVKNAPKFGEIAESFLEFMEGAIFVAHNVKFDYSFIQKEFARAGFDFVRPCICTVASMRKAYPGISSYGLKNLTEYFSISLNDHHRAMCDARAAAQLLLLINEKRGLSVDA